MNEPEYLTVPEVAALLRVHPSTVYEIIKRKRLPARRVGREYRAHRDDVRAYVSGSGYTPALAKTLAPAVVKGLRAVALLNETLTDIKQQIGHDENCGGRGQ